MAAYHEHFIAHRDLKPENILVDIKSQGYVTKVIDFGFAAKSKEKLQVFCGTPAYMSPEICAKKHYDGRAADIWASGVILYTMLFGVQPFTASNESDLYKKVQKGSFKMPSINPESNTFLSFPDVEDASTIRDLLNDILVIQED